MSSYDVYDMNANNGYDMNKNNGYDMKKRGVSTLNYRDRDKDVSLQIDSSHAICATVAGIIGICAGIYIGKKYIK